MKEIEVKFGKDYEKPLRNLKVVCHKNNYSYSTGNPRKTTPRCFAKDHDRLVPLIYKHDHLDPNKILGGVILCYHKTEILCHIWCVNEAAFTKEILDELKDGFVFDIWATNLKLSKAGNYKKR